MSDVVAGLVGGVVGGGGSLLTTWLASHLQMTRERERAAELDIPRKELLLTMLKGKDRVTRSLKRLCVVTGTTEEDCRRLLVSIGARGVVLKSGNEAWALIDRKPLTDLSYVVTEADD